MCGITGCIILNESSNELRNWVENSNQALIRRGPDGGGVFFHKNTGLGHRRLAILDTSENAAQPFTDNTGRYTIIFNGEFFNFKEHKDNLIKEGVQFRSTGDTEVLLQLFIKHGPECLERINGFFAFAIYDAVTEETFIARDRYGIKPLFIYESANFIAFASNLEALSAYPISTEINQNQLFAYLQLNYLPFQKSIINGVNRLKPGHFLIVQGKVLKEKKYYAIPNLPNGTYPTLSFQQTKDHLKEILTNAVARRMVSDVPLGCFLSGGIDSSIITAIAAKCKPDLKTFSIGYKDEPFFDETYYAQLVAEKHKTDHTVFKLSNDDLLKHFEGFLSGLDEPFADSSALAVYILCQETRKEVTVALSGDGADEIFAGYNKHAAELMVRQNGLLRPLMRLSKPFLDLMPQSRNSKWTNKFRQANKLAEGFQLSNSERYWRWAGYCNEKEALSLMSNPIIGDTYNADKAALLACINNDFNSVLRSDVALVLEGDMLVKADRMSMANSLEVRVPFLDVNVVNFAFNIPTHFKINPKDRKIILKQAFAEDLPTELLTRGKKGFEVPLLKWLTTDLKPLLVDDLLSKDFIEYQQLFQYDAVKNLLNQLFSGNPGDATARIWGLLIFQVWWKKHLNKTKDA